jgi:threonine dehydrogenase-like Zn-dependent dehydrogenase
VVIERQLRGICGTDKHSYPGYAVQYSGTEHERSLPFPIIPGHEVVGTLSAIGRHEGQLTDFNGKPLREGDRVVLGLRQQPQRSQPTPPVRQVRRLRVRFAGQLPVQGAGQPALGDRRVD